MDWLRKDLENEVYDVLILDYYDVPLEIDDYAINIIHNEITKILSNNKLIEKLIQLKNSNELEYYITLSDLANSICKKIILYNIVKILSKL